MFPWPQSVENRAAIRTALAALIAILISFKFHLETPYWSGMTVVIVSNLYTGSIIDKAMMRIIGTIAGAFLGYFVAGIVTNSFLLYLLCCFLIIAVSVYFFNYSRYGYAYLLGALCAFIIISQLAINPQNAFFVAIWRPVEIGIGVLVSAISVYAIFPNHIKDNMFVQVHDLFDDFLSEFNLLQEHLSKTQVDFTDLNASNLKIRKKVRKAVELIGALNQEIGVKKVDVDKFRAFLDTFYTICKQLQYLIIIPPEPENLLSFQILTIQPIFTAIQHDLVLLQSRFNNRLTDSIELQLGNALVELENEFHRKRKMFPVKNDFIYSFIHFLQQVNQCFSLMQALLTHIPVNTSPKYKMISRQQRLRSDYDLIKHCVKAGVSVLLALGFWLISNWPGGLNGIISSLIISIKGKNLFDMKNIGIHRLLGCFLGGGVALLYLNLFELNLFDFITVILVSVWAFSYLMFKITKYSYIGLQANIALIIALAQEGGPPLLLDPPLQRLGGIIIGIVATFIVANVLWRSDVWSILNRYLDKLYKYQTFNMTQVLLVPEEQRELHDLANLFWLVRGLLESLSNEHLTLKKQNRLSILTQRFKSLVISQATISHILVTIDLERARKTAELFHFDLILHEKKFIDLYEHHDTEGGKTLWQIFNEFLTDIEKKSSDSKIEDNDVRNLIAYVNALKQLAQRIQYNTFEKTNLFVKNVFNSVI